MLDNTPGIPPVAVDYFAQTTSLVVEPSKVALEGRTEDRDALRGPNGTKNAPCRCGAVLGCRVVILGKM